MATPFDAIVIGAGQSGPALAVRLARAGMKTALIEREHLGGTCVNDGCTPTKALVASARVAHAARQAAAFGVLIDGAVRVDMKAVKARKDAIVAQSLASLGEWLGRTPNLTVIRGHGRFVGPHTVRVEPVGDVAGDTEVGAAAAESLDLEAAKIFINTGARPVVPDWPGLSDLSGAPVLTNTSMMDLDVLPEHLLIVGGSYIGLEFAQMYRRFGARVTVVEHGDRLIAREDPEVSAEVQAILEREGIDFVLGARDFSVQQGVAPATVTLQLNAGDKLSTAARTIAASHLLLAIGRRPNSDDLGLPAAGIATDAHGYITVDDQLRTPVEGVWALGDVNGRGAFTHTSYNDFEIVAANLLDNDPRRVTDRIPTYALFIDPPLGRVGMTEAQVRASGRAALVGVMPMTRVGRARERGETQGFMKVLVDAQTHRILGAALLCIEGDEAVHALLDLMAADAPYTVMQRSVHIHPTVSELIPTLLGELKPLV